MNKDIQTWVKIAGLTEDDVPHQLKCLEEEMIEEWESADTFADSVDAFVDADFVRLVLYFLGYRRDDLDDKLIGMYEALVEKYSPEHDVLTVVQTHRAKVMEANFAKFVTGQKVVADTEAYLTMMGIDYHTNFYEGFYVFKSARCQTVNGKHYPRNKVLKPFNWRAPE